jgi:hypothetical protein
MHHTLQHLMQPVKYEALELADTVHFTLSPYINNAPPAKSLPPLVPAPMPAAASPIKLARRRFVLVGVLKTGETET